MRERLCDLLDLPVALARAVIDRRPDRRSAHLVGTLDGSEHDLVERVRERQQLVVIDLHDERDLVGVLAGHGAEDAESRGDGVAAALDRQFHDLRRIEIVGVLREARHARMLDPLIDRENGHVPGSRQPAVRVDPGEVAEHPVVPVRRAPHPIQEVRSGNVNSVFRDARARVVEQRFRVVAQELQDFIIHRSIPDQ